MAPPLGHQKTTATGAAALLVVVATLLALTTTGHQATALAPQTCGDFTRCSECVFDSSDGVLSTPLPCSWCASTASCVRFDSDAASICADIRNETWNPSCPDMQCSAANTSNNIYFCRGPLIAALVFALLLNIVNVLYFGWLCAIWQLPWRYSNINDVLAEYITRSGSILASISAPSAPAHLKNRAGSRTGSSCPICKLQQADPLGPGGVCFWCGVARYAFIPLYIGLVGGGVTVLMVFSLPIKPWFSDWYYALLLSTPYVTYTLFVGYMYVCRVSIVGDASQKTTTFFQLAWVLRGRSISTLFPEIDEVGGSKSNPQSATATASPPLPPQPLGGIPGAPAVAPAAAPPAATPAATPSVASCVSFKAPSMSEEFINARMAETVQLLNIDVLPKEFRKVLQANLANDEFIMWWVQPSSSDIAGDYKWLVHALCSGVALGVWMWIASSVTEKGYPISRLVETSNLSILGTMITIFNAVMLLITVMGFSRLYIVTNKRLITVAGGILGAHVMSTEVNSIKYASIYGYNEWGLGDMLTFSWEIPSGVRRMPPIATTSFPALADVDGFLEAFRMIAPRLDTTDVIRKNIRHTRTVWRMHIFVNILCMAILPVVVLYSQIAPLAIDFFLLLILLNVNVCIIQRGLRHQQITIAPLNLADAWVHPDDMEGSAPAKQSFLKTLIADSKFHWRNKPTVELPQLSDIANKIREKKVQKES